MGEALLVGPAVFVGPPFAIRISVGVGPAQHVSEVGLFLHWVSFSGRAQYDLSFFAVTQVSPP